MAFLNSLDPKQKADRLKLPLAYDLLLQTRRQLANYQVLLYTAEMEALYQSWPAAVKRVGTRDCRIGATALVHGFTVITCNLSHFQPCRMSKQQIGPNKLIFANPEPFCAASPFLLYIRQQGDYP